MRVEESMILAIFGLWLAFAVYAIGTIDQIDDLDPKLWQSVSAWPLLD